jgi:hypothetical protein
MFSDYEAWKGKNKNEFIGRSIKIISGMYLLKE